LTKNKKINPIFLFCLAFTLAF